MSAFRIVQLDPIPPDVLVSTRASTELQHAIADLVTSQYGGADEATKWPYIYKHVRALYRREFGCEIRTANVQLSHTLFPPEPLVSCSTLGCRLLRMAKDADGNELRIAIFLYHQLVTYNKLRMTSKQRVAITDVMMLWGNSSATNDTVTRIRVLRDELHKEFTSTNGCILFDGAIHPNEALMKAHGVASRRSLMDSFTIDANELQLHEVELMMQYMHSYAIIEHLDTEAGEHANRIALTDDWDVMQSREKLQRTLPREPTLFSRSRPPMDLPAAADEPVVEAKEEKEDTVVRGPNSWDWSHDVKFNKGDRICLDRTVLYKNGTSTSSLQDGTFVSRSGDGRFMRVDRGGVLTPYIIKMTRGKDHVYEYDDTHVSSDERVKRIVVTAVKGL